MSPFRKGGAYLLSIAVVPSPLSDEGIGVFLRKINAQLGWPTFVVVGMEPQPHDHW